MSIAADHPVLAFAGDRLIARGAAGEALAAIKAATEAGEGVLVFDAATGKVIDLDLRGDLAASLARLAPPPDLAQRGPGRPKLGVTAREVTR